MLARHREGTQIGDDECIHPRIIERFAVRGQKRDIARIHERVERHVDRRPARMHALDHGGNLVEGEVVCPRPHAETVAGQIDRICTEAQCGIELRRAADGSEQLAIARRRAAYWDASHLW